MTYPIKTGELTKYRKTLYIIREMYNKTVLEKNAKNFKAKKKSMLERIS